MKEEHAVLRVETEMKIGSRLRSMTSHGSFIDDL